MDQNESIRWFGALTEAAAAEEQAKKNEEKKGFFCLQRMKTEQIIPNNQKEICYI